ncbi:XRE family transcriptional regulator [Cupriavidus necator]|uniref:helix-turn-helix domain-containing protein n=1 Tax=Cupriavidus necator TaxID=106590 RepID=UPI00148F69AE|nr:helix-turn-helix transcriptional regulator [Cupriavidus necator]NOV25544.1 XRE family transcriptional regulator [Cupriavidus necator]
MKRTLRHRFGKRIRELRQATGLSQEAFADHVGFARTYMSRIETGGANVREHEIRWMREHGN